MEKAQQQKNEFYNNCIQSVLCCEYIDDDPNKGCYAEHGFTESDIDAMSRIVLRRICDGFLEAKLDKNTTILDVIQDVGIEYASGHFWGSLRGHSYNFASEWYVPYKGYSRRLHGIAQAIGCRVSCVDKRIYLKF